MIKRDKLIVFSENIQFVLISTKSNLPFGPWFAHFGVHRYLFSVEQKNVTQGFMTLLSDDGGRYMASEKQVSSSLRSSVLEKEASDKNQRVFAGDQRGC